MTHPQYAQGNDPRYAQYAQGGGAPQRPANPGQPRGMQGHAPAGQGGAQQYQQPQYQTPQYQTPQYQAPQQQTYQGAQQSRAGQGAPAGQAPQYRQPTQQPTYHQQPQGGGQNDFGASRYGGASPQPQGADQGTIAQALADAQAGHSYGSRPAAPSAPQREPLSQFSAPDYFADSASSPLESQRAQMFGTSGDAARSGPAAADYRFDGAPESPFARSRDSYSDQRSTLHSYGSSFDQADDAGFEQGDFGHGADSDTIFSSSEQGDANFYDGEYADEDFDEETGSRKSMLVIGVLVGALGLGGALAYAYKFGGLGDKLNTAAAPPVISADKNPSKEKPVQAGGKQFAGGKKLFYDRLRDEDGKIGSTPERLVSRQEDVMGSTNAAGTLTPVKATDPVAARPAPAATKDGAPRKVQTLTVLPNGRIVKADPNTTATAAPVKKSEDIPALKSTSVTPVKSQPVAKKPVQTALMTPKAQPVVPQTKTVAPKRPVAIPTPSQAAGSGFVVQVAARRNQTDALEAFADLQQKYPTILGNYRPLIQRADLGSKGVWYRLRLGPLQTKDSASDLCDKLKAAGLKSCLVNSL